MNAQHQDNIFKNLSSVGLPDGKDEWKPEQFLKKWVAILRASMNCVNMDILTRAQMVTVMGSKQYIMISANTVLSPGEFRTLFQIAFGMFKNAVDALSKQDTAIFIKSELGAMEQYVKVRLVISTDVWAETETFIHNEYTYWLLNTTQIASTPGSSVEIVPFPKLLKNPAHINIINEWLLSEELIIKEGNDSRRPYTWVVKDENDFYEIKGETGKDIYDEGNVRPPSLRYQIAAFSLYLHYECKCLNLGKYSASKVSRSVLEYYTKEKPYDGSMKKAFEDNDAAKALTTPYYKYFKSLKPKLMP